MLTFGMVAAIIGNFMGRMDFTGTVKLVMLMMLAIMVGWLGYERKTSWTKQRNNQMNKELAFKLLQKMVLSKQELQKAFQRKRSWRPSEKACACADVEQEILALRMAMEYLKEDIIK